MAKKSNGKRGGTIMKDAGQAGANLGKGMKSMGSKFKSAFRLNDKPQKKIPRKK